MSGKPDAWTVRKNSFGSDWLMRNGESVLNFDQVGSHHRDYIVRALNSHDALLKQAVGRYADISNTAEASRTEFDRLILKDLERVIAQAEALS